MRSKIRNAALGVVMFSALIATRALAADGGTWSVSKSSGDAWIVGSGAEQASLKQEDVLKPGDSVRTGNNGRVLLVRGEETILISPNSVIGVPAENKDGMATTIIQQAGSILLEVEKQNVKHFEVETPYLAAVVKGTHFSVTVGAKSTSVGVLRGQVEVSDFRSGNIAQVMPGQMATSFFQGKPGLSLSGTGTFNPIEQGQPRQSSVQRIPVPKGGLSAPALGKGNVIHALGPAGQHAGKMTTASDHPSSTVVNKLSGKGVIHLSTAIGEVHLDVTKATHGLARSGSVVAQIKNGSKTAVATAPNTTIWSDNKSGTSTASATGEASSGSATTGNNAASSVAATSSSAVTAIAAAIPAAVNPAAVNPGTGQAANPAVGSSHAAAGPPALPAGLSPAVLIPVATGSDGPGGQGSGKRGANVQNGLAGLGLGGLGLGGLGVIGITVLGGSGHH